MAALQSFKARLVDRMIGIGVDFTQDHLAIVLTLDAPSCEVLLGALAITKGVHTK